MLRAGGSFSEGVPAPGAEGTLSEGSARARGWDFPPTRTGRTGVAELGRGDGPGSPLPSGPVRRSTARALVGSPLREVEAGTPTSRGGASARSLLPPSLCSEPNPGSAPQLSPGLGDPPFPALGPDSNAPAGAPDGPRPPGRHPAPLSRELGRRDPRAPPTRPLRPASRSCPAHMPAGLPPVYAPPLGRLAQCPTGHHGTRTRGATAGEPMHGARADVHCELVRVLGPPRRECAVQERAGRWERAVLGEGGRRGRERRGEEGKVWGGERPQGRVWIPGRTPPRPGRLP